MALTVHVYAQQAPKPASPQPGAPATTPGAVAAQTESIGPEVGVNVDLDRQWFLYARAAYDHNFRNEWTQGIANGELGAGYRF